MRVGVRKGRIFIMDFVSVINENGKVVFFVGYFYIGKSMIFVLVFFEGFFFFEYRKYCCGCKGWEDFCYRRY